MDHAFERRVQWKLDFIIMQLNSVLAREARIMATVQELQAEVDQVVGVEASAVALLNGISQMLKDALASGNPQAIQDAIDKLEASKLGLAAAVAANTPPTPYLWLILGTKTWSCSSTAMATGAQSTASKGTSSPRGATSGPPRSPT